MEVTLLGREGFVKVMWLGREGFVKIDVVRWGRFCGGDVVS